MMTTGYFKSVTTQTIDRRPHRYWRILALTTASNYYCGLGELKFFTGSGGVGEAIASGIAFGGSNDGGTFFYSTAFDGDPTTRWAADYAGAGSGRLNTPDALTDANTAWIGQDFGNKVVIGGLSIQAANDAGEVPVKFALQYSDYDGPESLSTPSVGTSIHGIHDLQLTDPPWLHGTWETLQVFTATTWKDLATQSFTVTATYGVVTEVFVPETIPRDYLALVIPLHADKPNYMSLLDTNLEAARQFQISCGLLSVAFDLDTAIGKQLDHTGERVGISRDVPVPIPNVFFTFGDAARGFNRGFWQYGQAVTSYGIYSFDDETYRRILRAKVLANNSDGSLADTKAILQQFFLGTKAVYSVVASDEGSYGQPTCDATMTIAFSGVLPSLVYMIILEQGLIPLVPAGTRLSVVGTTVSELPCFGFGVANEFIGGFGTAAVNLFSFGVVGSGFGDGYWRSANVAKYSNRAAWAREPTYLAAQGIATNG